MGSRKSKLSSKTPEANLSLEGRQNKITVRTVRVKTIINVEMNKRRQNKTFIAGDLGLEKHLVA